MEALWSRVQKRDEATSAFASDRREEELVRVGCAVFDWRQRVAAMAAGVHTVSRIHGSVNMDTEEDVTNTLQAADIMVLRSHSLVE